MKHMKRRPSLVLVRSRLILTVAIAQAAICWLPEISRAEDSSALIWRGFLTTGVSVSDSAQEYRGDINETPNFAKHSKFGLNLNSKISPSIDVAAQMVVDQEALHPDWAFASWYPINSFAIRTGKQKFPIWLMSDRLDVGKTYPWITPPEEVYGQNPIGAISGIGASYNLDLGAIEILSEFIFGAVKETIAGDQSVNGEKLVSKVTADDTIAVNLVVGNEYVKVRAGGASSRRVNSETSLYSLKNITASFWSYGLQVHYHGALVLSEYAVVSSKMDDSEVRKADQSAVDAAARAANSDDELVRMQAQQAMVNALVHNSSIMDGKSFYITGGYQAGDWLPHLTYARLITPDDSIAYGDQYSVTTGLKYDINLGTDLKIEWQRVTPEKGSFGLFVREGFNPTERFEPINIYSVAMDFVF